MRRTLSSGTLFEVLTAIVLIVVLTGKANCQQASAEVKTPIAANGSAGHQLPTPTPPFKRMFWYGQLKDANTRLPEITSQSAAATTIPMWKYAVTSSRDGNSYSGSMVGRNAFFHGHRVTSIPVYLVPIRFTFQATGVVFDPTVNDGCSPTGTTAISLVQGSPIFQSSVYTMNGITVGTTQYVDAFERANFWSLAKGTPYHTLLGPVTTLPLVNVTVPTANGTTEVPTGACRSVGLMDLNWWEPDNGGGEARSLLASLAAQGAGPTSLVMFMFNSVFEYIGTTSNCCVLGFHDSFLTNGGSGPLQTYSTTSWDTSGAIGGDIATTAHEVAEWMDDPLGTNPTPAWGHTGQVSGCQNNLEVGDPLSGTFFPAVTLAGFAYHPQELAFFSWFYGAPSLGTGGLFSNNGSFATDAGAVCM